MELKELFDNQEYIEIDIMNDTDALDLHNKLRDRYNFMDNTTVIISDNVLYYLLNMPYGVSAGFSMNELRDYLDGTAVCFTVATE